MDLRDSAPVENGDRRLPLDVPPRVMIAFDQLTSAEQDAVLTALQRLEQAGPTAPSTADATRLAGPDPLYVLRPAPDVRMIVRAAAGEPVEVVDIVRPAALRNFAHAT
jgi:hypothetical protein